MQGSPGTASGPLSTAGKGERSKGNDLIFCYQNGVCGGVGAGAEAEGVAGQWVTSPYRYEALGSIPSTNRKGKRRRKWLFFKP